MIDRVLHGGVVNSSRCIARLVLPELQPRRQRDHARRDLLIVDELRRVRRARSSPATRRRSTRWTHRRLGGRARLQGRADPDLGRPAVRSREGGRQPRPIATRSRASLRSHGVADHRAVDPSAGPAGRRASGLRRGVRRLRARRRCAATRRRARTGRSSRCKLAAKASQHLGLHGHASPSPGALAWPYLYPWPQRPAGPDRDRLRRAGQALAADPRRLRRGRRRRLLRAPSGRGPARRRDLRDVPRAGRTTTRAATSSTIPSTSCCSSSTISSSSTSTTSASRRSTSRTPSSTRPAGRASIPASSPGSTAPGASARWATARSISAASSRKLAQYGYDGWAVLEWECCLKHPEDGAPKARHSSRDHIIRVTEKAFDDFAGGSRPKRPGACWAC